MWLTQVFLSHLSHLSPSCCSAALFPFHKSVLPALLTAQLWPGWGQVGAAGAALIWHGAVLGSAHRGYPCRLQLPKPCQVNPIRLFKHDLQLCFLNLKKSFANHQLWWLAKIWRCNGCPLTPHFYKSAKNGSSAQSHKLHSGSDSRLYLLEFHLRLSWSLSGMLSFNIFLIQNGSYPYSLFFLYQKLWLGHIFPNISVK